jgi:hypothetical protein
MPDDEDPSVARGNPRGSIEQFALPSILAPAPPEDRSGALHRSTALLPAALAGRLFRDSRREEGSGRQLFL